MEEFDPTVKIKKRAANFQEYREKRQKNYLQKINILVIALLLGSISLIFFVFVQFAILETFFQTSFEISPLIKSFGIPTRSLLSFLVTGTLPISVLVDESNIIQQKLEVPILLTNKKLSFVWLVYFADFLLTFLAVAGSDASGKGNGFVPFIIAGIFSTSVLYLTRGIGALLSKIRKTWHSYQILDVYGFDPQPLHEDEEKFKLSEEVRLARNEAEEAQKILEDERVNYVQELNSARDKYTEQIESQIAQHTQKVSLLTERINKYQSYLGSVDELKSTFNKVKKTLLDFVPQGRGFFEKFSTIDESLKNFSFPKVDLTPIEINETQVSSQTIQKEYYVKWQTSGYTSKNLPLPAEISPIAVSLLKAMEAQSFPPPRMELYAPKNNLSHCLSLYFDLHNVVVYCRDEAYSEGKEWEFEDELDFKNRMNYQKEVEKLSVHHFTKDEVMSGLDIVLSQIEQSIAKGKDIEAEGL